MKKNALDTIAEKPCLTLSFSIAENEVWSSKKSLTEWAVREGCRPVWENVVGENSSDQLILQVLRMNPGTELQLLSNNGVFPFFALRLNGKKPKELKLPEGVFYAESCIWCKWEQHDVNLCLLQTR